MNSQQIEEIRTMLVHQCNAALSMPAPLTGIAEVSRQAEQVIATQYARITELEACLRHIEDEWSMAIQGDLENGVRSLNERAAAEFVAKYPEVSKFGGVIDTALNSIGDGE